MTLAFKRWRSAWKKRISECNKRSIKLLMMVMMRMRECWWRSSKNWRMATIKEEREETDNSRIKRMEDICRTEEILQSTQWWKTLPATIMRWIRDSWKSKMSRERPDRIWEPNNKFKRTRRKMKRWVNIRTCLTARWERRRKRRRRRRSTMVRSTSES